MKVDQLKQVSSVQPSDSLVLAETLSMEFHFNITVISVESTTPLHFFYLFLEAKVLFKPQHITTFFLNKTKQNNERHYHTLGM